MKSKSICFVISFMMLILSACSFADFWPSSDYMDSPEFLIEPIPETEEAYEMDEIEIDLPEEDEDNLTEVVSEEDDSDLIGQVEPDANVLENDASSFYYSRLSDADKLTYDTILEAVLACKKATLPAESVDSLERVFSCVMNDHPEIFYIYGYSCTKEYLGDDLQRVYLEGTKNMEPDEIERRKEAIEKKTDAILAEMSDITDPYEILKYIYRYIIDHTEYDLHSVDNQNICSVLLNGSSVCQGYAKTFQYLLQKKGIQTALIQGTVTGGGNHAWNMVLLNGEYYYVDVTWGDASYKRSGDNQVIQEKKLTINYDYMCVTTAEICKTHQIEPIVKLPVCVAVKDNYYRREGFYFSSVDEEQLQKIFAREYENGSTSITLKCANEAVYKMMCSYLLEEQKVFSYLQGEGGSVGYANNDAMWSITFWL